MIDIQYFMIEAFKLIDIEIINGVPYCRYDKADDCAHVGFAIEVEQLFGPTRCGKEQTIDDIIIWKNYYY